MSRRLITILNDGGRANYLPGVEHDARNYLDFFHLPEGGYPSLQLAAVNSLRIS